MRRLAAAILMALPAFVVAGAAGAQQHPGAAASAAEAQTWAFAIGSGTLKGDLPGRYAGYDLVVFDGQEAKRGQIAALQEGGATVLGYLSVGTIERFRPWYRKLKRYRIAPNLDWEGEYFAKVSKRGFRKQVGKRIAPRLYRKGFDGLFLDNVDMIESYRRQAKGMRKLVGVLSRLVRADGGVLFAQNGFEIIAPMLRHLDGWNREDVTTSYDFDRERYRQRRPGAIERIQDELRAVATGGLLVTATDYTAKPAGGVVERAVANACAAGALPYVSDIELERVPEPRACP